MVASGTENVDHFGNEVGTWIKSKRGHRPSPRAISNLEQLRSLLLFTRKRASIRYRWCSVDARKPVDLLHRLYVESKYLSLVYVINTREVGKSAVEQRTTMMESSRGALVLLLLFGLILQESLADTKYYVKLRTNATDPFKVAGGLRMLRQDEIDRSNIGASRAVSQVGKSRSSFRLDDETMIRESLKANDERRNSFVESSTFDPDVLNKFLDEYANKIKINTDKNKDHPLKIAKPLISNEDKTSHTDVTSSTEDDRETNNGTENALNSTLDSSGITSQELNDTVKRNKYFGVNSNDDRGGWVTLDAIPWSKSKISKWQANPSSQRPWPEMKLWDKPNNGKPWESNQPSRPAYINNEPWNNRPDFQPDRLQQSRPSTPTRPSPSNRPSYFDDRFDSNPSQAQKWPPERPVSSWEKFPTSNSYRPNSDIITDDRPSNFPNSWNKFTQTSSNGNKPTFSIYDNNRDRYTNNGNNNNNYNGNKYNQQDEPHDWHDHKNNYPSKDRPSHFGLRPGGDDIDQDHSNRPNHQSHYGFNLDHPQGHPSSGEGQWVLLSTNRGYSKSRQRSIKLEVPVNGTRVRTKIDTAKLMTGTKDEDDGTVPVMTSKRQVRLTVLPSINGTNTTTSHGGLLEVERTFKSVDQSRLEYEQANKIKRKPHTTTLLNKRPIRNTIVGRPSNSAVLAAVGAGMLPATMAMMIPMMLGRKKRSLNYPSPRIILPYEFNEDSLNFYRRSQRRRRELMLEERR